MAKVVNNPNYVPRGGKGKTFLNVAVAFVAVFIGFVFLLWNGPVAPIKFLSAPVFIFVGWWLSKWVPRENKK